MKDNTRLTAEELDYAFYAIKREAKEEGILFTECRMLQKSLTKSFSILQKLLGVSDEHYNQLVELLHENTGFKETGWLDLLHRHGLNWKEEDFSLSHQEVMKMIAEQHRQEGEVMVRFRILINGRNHGFNIDEYKDLIESDDYLFSEFQRALDDFGDKFMGRLVRKFFEYKCKQKNLEVWEKLQQKPSLTMFLICLLFYSSFLFLDVLGVLNYVLPPLAFIILCNLFAYCLL